MRGALVVAMVLLASAPAAAKKAKKKAAAAQAAVIAPASDVGPATPERAGMEDAAAAPATMGAAAPLQLESPWGVAAEARVDSGGFSGYGVRPDAGALVKPQARVTPQYRHDALRISVPLSVSHRQTLGASLLETRAAGGVEAKYRFSSKLRLGLEGALVGTWRPGWADLYQPLPGGGYAPTDRFSHFDKRLGAQVAGMPLRHQHARLKYRFTAADYTIDPAYSAANPTHLTPFTNTQHEVQATWRYLQDEWKVGARLEGFLRSDAYMYSRDAGTGKTHAGAGGPPPNPLQVFRGIEPGVEGEWTPAGLGLEVSAGYGFEVVQDAYQGYYSFTGHHPKLKVEYDLLHRATLGVGLEAFVRTYADTSYQAGGSHPPLSWGDRRVDNRVQATFDAEVPLRNGLSLTGEVAFVQRATNFPSYEPGVYPAGRAYNIQWSYTNLSAQVGVRWAFEAGAADAAED